MYFANPQIIEDVLRAEGKYPTRFQDMDDKITWFFNHLGYEVPMGSA